MIVAEMPASSLSSRSAALSVFSPPPLPLGAAARHRACGVCEEAASPKRRPCHADGQRGAMRRRGNSRSCHYYSAEYDEETHSKSPVLTSPSPRYLPLRSPPQWTKGVTPNASLPLASPSRACGRSSRISPASPHAPSTLCRVCPACESENYRYDYRFRNRRPQTLCAYRGHGR